MCVQLKWMKRITIAIFVCSQQHPRRMTSTTKVLKINTPEEHHVLLAFAEFQFGFATKVNLMKCNAFVKSAGTTFESGM